MKKDYLNILSQIDAEINKSSVNKPANLIIVSKSQPAQSIRTLLKLGYNKYGENYIDEAISKIQEINEDDIEWHFIGNIQSNKIKKIAKYFSWVQTVSTEKHAKLLNDECKKLDKMMNICIQVNIDNEESKSGININETEAFLKMISIHKFLSIRGIMSIPSKLNALKENENSYNILKSEYDKLSKQYKSIDTLSLGMSNDFKLALNRGSNMIRIGSLIFGERRS
ncbi:MAG: YggS family pyridoxal phosphate-dependent enzyme [Gammaproteobacteria bacterium]|jgi:PLP dependent protein|nr:YggS family pyridoxal phosphate-dependent enzyme [Gammaproteobacteria bacterium]MBT7076229.1 YggS family pyridoxal phosphate-dependent enzyme [Pelagibacterales bacterium]MBT4462513.1 YggS family pyridoxal phosphate-dependent enzyme [Gammaproteobacteria bacterium]MBT4654760.1 YggS family pyridoxal phosphate-dependent enzyme [Gammaproteobacteria bacterium]MBT5116957.1 YggS family pyridoxal phosphate-dependent enzyme [Gammaproteobacteria bacterium]